MRIYSFDNYREFLKKYIHSLPKRGHGEISRMADALRIPQPLMSQILSGNKDLNLDQADLLGDYLNFTENEKSYLFVLVQIEKSGRANLKKHFIKERDKLKNGALDVQTVISPTRVLNDVEKSIFYSSWLYQAIRLLTSIESKKYSTLDAMAEALDYDRKQVSEVMAFLIKTGLCIFENGTYKMGPSSTHLENSSPHLPRYRTNWRLQSILRSDRVTAEDLMFTAPMTLSKKDFNKIREQILALIKNIYSTVESSSAEELVCINIDYFKIL